MGVAASAAGPPIRVAPTSIVARIGAASCTILRRRRGMAVFDEGGRMGQLTYDIRDGIAKVTFDSGGMNTLSQAAVGDLRAVTADIVKAHAKTPLVGVILTGNRFGL